MQPAGPLSLETLEPRLLLSADPIGSQSLMPLETSLSGHAILVDVTGTDEGQPESPSPILTIDLPAADQTEDTGTTRSGGLLTDNDLNDSADQLADEMLGADVENRLVDENLTAPLAAAIEQAGCDVVTEVKPSGLHIVLQNGSAGPAVPGQQEIVPDPKALPIEIRGPPAAGSDSLSATNRNGLSVESNSYEVTAGDNMPVVAGFMALGVQGLRVADADTSNWQGQIIYLDFEGEQNVTCKGSVTAGSFDFPVFQAPGDPARHEQVAIEYFLAKAEEIFPGSGSSFASQPSPRIKYSTVAGDDSTFVSSVDMAEQMDAGTHDLMDAAPAVTDQVARLAADTGYLGRLADMIVDDVGYLAEFLGSDGIERGPPAPPSSSAAVLYDGGDSPLSSHDRFNWDGGIVPRAGDDAVISLLGSDLAATCGGTSGSHIIRSIVSGEVFVLSGGSSAAFGGASELGFSFCAPLSSPSRWLSLVPRALSQDSLRYQLDKAEGAAHSIPVYRLGNVGENPKNT